LQPTGGEKPEGRAQPSPGALAHAPAFRALVARRRAVAAALLALHFAAYFGFLLATQLARPFLAERVGSWANRAIVAGTAVIALAFVVNWLFAAWASRHFDPEAQRLRSLHRG